MIRHIAYDETKIAQFPRPEVEYTAHAFFWDFDHKPIGWGCITDGLCDRAEAFDALENYFTSHDPSLFNCRLICTDWAAAVDGYAPTKDCTQEFINAWHARQRIAAE